MLNMLQKHLLGCTCGKCPTKRYVKKPISPDFKEAVRRVVASLPKDGKECGVCGLRGRHKFTCLYYDHI